MKRTTRRVLFYSAIVLFLFFGYIAILYAQGYKYSFRDNKFHRTGAISLKVNTDAKVYLDDNLEDNTSFIGNAFSKGGLIPGQYVVRVTQDGYTTWQKKATVEEGYLVDFPRVLILPESEDERAKLIEEIESLLYLPTPSPTPVVSATIKPSKTPSPSLSPGITEPYYIKSKTLYRNGVEPEALAQNVAGFKLSKNSSRIIWWNNNNEIRVMWLEDSGYQPYHKKGDVELVTRLSTKIRSIGWFRDEDHLVVDSLGYKIVELDTRGGINIIKI